MEPSENNPVDPKQKAEEAAAVKGMHDEGIDIVSSEAASYDEPAPAEAATVPAPEAPVPKPTEALAGAEAKLYSRPEAFVMPQNRTEAPKPSAPAAPKPQPTPVPTQPVSSLESEVSDILGKGPAKDLSKNDPSIKPLRTFKSDAEEAIRYQNVSTIDIAVAAQKKKEATPIEYEKEKSSSPKALVFAAFALVVLLGGGWYAWYSLSKEAAPETAAPAIQVRSLVPYAKASTVALEPGSAPLELIAAKLSALNPSLGETGVVVPVDSNASTQASALSTALRDTKMPSRLARSLSGEYTFGTYVYDVESPFIVMKDTFFQNAYAGMLDWEKDIKNDLLPLIRLARPNEAISGQVDRFEDVVVSNVDARALKDELGQTILIYAFADKDTVVITTSISGLKHLLETLLSVRTIQ